MYAFKRFIRRIEKRVIRAVFLCTRKLHSRIVISDFKASRCFLEEKRPFRKIDISTCERMNDRSLELSIIIPVYRNSKYLFECLKSVFDQKSRYDVEIILSLDGADEECTKIARSYISDSRAILIENDNFGVSHARNEALKIAKGRYILFVDSDDYIAPTLIDDMLDSAIKYNVDAVTSSFQYIDVSGRKKTIMFQKDGITKYGSSDHKLNGFPWGNIMRASLFSDIEFPDGYIFEDTIMAYFIVSECRSIMHLSTIEYYYRNNPKGITQTCQCDYRGLDSLWVTELCLEDLQKLGRTFSQQLYVQTLKQLSIIIFSRTKSMKENERIHLFCVCKEIWERFAGKCNHNVNDVYYSSIKQAFANNDYGVWKYSCHCMLKQ